MSAPRDVSAPREAGSAGGRGAERRRVLFAALALASLPAVALGVGVHAAGLRAARAAEAPRLLAVVGALPSSDLALSGGSRWLRALTLEEPTAAFADAPAAPDPDPGGGALGVPREAFFAAEGAR